jgi:hypothetical protein
MKRGYVLAGIALTAGIALAGVGAVAQASTDPLDPVSVVGELGQARDAGDALPSSLQLADVGIGGLVARSARSLAIADGRQFWVAQDAAGDICLVVAFGEGRFVAATCGRPDAVQRQGVELGFQEGTRDSAVAYLLPDSVEFSTLSAPWQVVSDNLVVGPSDGGPATTLDVDGDVVHVNR